MDLNNSIIFGGIDSADYGIYVAGNAVFNSPERDVTMIDVPGRNGQLTFDNGRFMNIEVTYNAFVTGDNSNDIADNIRGYRNAIGSLIGYQRLEDTFHTDEFRQAIFRNGIEVEPTIYQTGGYFDITFDCKPQRWIVIANDPMPAENQHVLDGYEPVMPSKPLLMVVYNKATIGDSSPGQLEFAFEYNLTIDRNTTQTPNTYGWNCMYIDCELMEAYEYAVNTDDNVGSGAISSCNTRISAPQGFPIIPSNYPSNYSFLTSAPVHIASVYMYRRLWRL